MPIKDKIKKLVNESARKAFGDALPAGFDAHIGRSAERIHGDYFTNSALRLANVFKKDPRLRQGYGGQACDIATQIGDQILAQTRQSGGQESDMIVKVEVVHPGFLNIFLSDKFVQNQIKEILNKKDKYGNIKTPNSKLKTPKILIEFIAANPTGQMHLGHGRNAFWGDALANVLGKAGCNVKREYYINDAKASNQIKELGKTALGEGETYLNDYLRQKLKARQNDLVGLAKSAKLKKIKKAGIASPELSAKAGIASPELSAKAGIASPELSAKAGIASPELYAEAGYSIAGDIQKDNKKFIEKDLKIKFDKWFSEENELYKKGAVEKMHKWLKDNNLVYEKEGAEWLKISQYGDSEDRVLVRSDEARTPAYLLPDIAYHQNKIKRGFNRLINIWGADHQGHVKSMKAAMKMLGFGGDLDILIAQMVAIKEGGERMKLSKRKGKIVTLESLIDEVGLDSARFFYLMKSLDTQMELDMDLMKKQSSENPVFYVQYAHARIASIIRKAQSPPEWLSARTTAIVQSGGCRAGVKREAKNKKNYLEMLSTESELDLIKELTKFPELIDEIARDYQVHKLTHYAVSLADKFHHFYHECRVITDDELLTGARLALIKAVQIMLRDTLDLLGVSAPEKM